MRIATMVLSLALAVMVFLWANDLSKLAALFDRDAVSTVASGGIWGAILWVVGAAFVYAYPRVAIGAYLLSFIVMASIGFSANFDNDLMVYCWAGLVFMVMSYLTWRDMKKQAKRSVREEDEARRQQEYRDYQLAKLLHQQSSSQSGQPQPLVNAAPKPVATQPSPPGYTEWMALHGDGKKTKKSLFRRR
ncbi:MAG: hypothetical protein M9953_03190 [Thermomicrobiales bacterium]|nr:hypothetical protein [Thermomicrobiales bacterium]MCO5218645.1 hypothetical protein [Thermomicrobiales bacterium]MCO5224322.1 hypothetical protein [Thermomicrobiales bacterium]MCO5229061.1 hypothetical protein [Thermomicrobiales bacterium]